MTDHDDQRSTSRRSILGGTIGAGALGVLGTAAAGLSSAGTASAHGTITTYSTINGARTVYEVNGNLASWGYRPSFHTRLNTWLAFWNANTPSGYANASRIWGYGAHYDGRPTEAHNNGRGFDLSRIYTGSTRRFIARHDIWKNWSGSDLTTARRHYWATAASAHYHFRNVLTYLYNADHDNHIHIDNLVSGTSNSSFDSSSRAQVLHVQASCRYVWGLPTTVDGIWGSQTSSHSTRVLRAAGVTTGGIGTQSPAGSPSTGRRCARATAPRPTGLPDLVGVAPARRRPRNRWLRGRRGDRTSGRSEDVVPGVRLGRGWCPAGRPGSPRTPARAPRGCS